MITDDPTDDVDEPTELVRRHTVLSVVVGWSASGLTNVDAGVTGSGGPPVRGVFVPPTELFWRFAKPPATVDGPGVGLRSWEVEAFCAAGLAADPAVLDVLGSPLVRASTAVGVELRELTVAFLSQRAADAYRRATAADFARAAAAMAAGGTPRWRQVAEVIRLLIVGERLLRTGQLSVDLSEHRDLLLAVRAGELPWPETSQWVESLRDRSAEAVLRSPLPALPNTAAVQHWLSSVRRRSLTDQRH
jgi:hypothetical protein